MVISRIQWKRETKPDPEPLGYPPLAYTGEAGDNGETASAIAKTLSLVTTNPPH
jgi:hypothetical protein